ncbi:hypothetical protein NDN08_002693 [Rhodosorus marinus]|uniref:Uncharacterized protein n=1 Tax=Rhodosorus marinus TaxID=101924 RepID=A0AAV8UUH6_9RHOD|nr:hypothetical protein NDN08_002693 [Rhodosorus marinus]
MSGLPMKKKVQGVVKAVLSGDTVVIVKPGMPKGGPPPEVRLSLSSLKAPAVKPGGSGGDEPYAWASREFLRKALAGKNVMFIAEYNVPQLNRPMGTIYCENSSGEVESVSRMILREGLARVRRPNNPKEDRSFDYEELCLLEDDAQEQKIGLFQEGDMPPELGRTILDTPDTVDYLTKVRGKPVEGVVDYIINGSVMKILIQEKPGFYRHLTVCLSGVQSPGFRRPETEDAEGASPPALVAMPFALNAKFYTESVLLQRDVEVVFEGADKSGNLYGQVNQTGSAVRVAENLLRMGYAKTVAWSMQMTSNASVLRATEKSAMKARVGIWHDYVPNPNAAVASTDVYHGRVVEIFSGDVIIVADDATGDFRRVCFASLRAPKLGRGSDRDMPVAWEAREYLRQRLIGRRVKVSVDYQRKPQPESPMKDIMSYATITKDRGGKENTEEDIGMGLVAGGFVSLIRHRSDEERARNYEQYVQLEKEATNAKKGIHSDKNIPVRRVNDLTGSENKKRNRDMLSSFADSGPHKGILEYASTGSRYRIYLPSHSCTLALALKGVRCPVPSRTLHGESAAQPGQPFGDEALHFVKLSFLQRDVQVDISSVDKTGAFLGTVRLTGQTPQAPMIDIGLSLLSHGYASLNEFFDPDRDEGGQIYSKTQEDAKTADKGIWKDYKVQEAAAQKEIEAQQTAGQVRGRVVDVGYGGKIVLHAGVPNVEESIRILETSLATLDVGDSNLPISMIKPGDGYAGKSAYDGSWYRCRVYSIDANSGKAKVRFIDYGIDDVVSARDLKRLPSEASGIPKLAFPIRFQYVVVPGDGDDYGIDAGQYLRELVYGKEVTAEVAYRDSDGTAIATVSLDGKDVASEMLKVGLARVLRQYNRHSKAAFEKYAADEEIGKKTHNYLWVHGDPYGSDEDDAEADKEARERRYGGVPRK